MIAFAMLAAMTVTAEPPPVEDLLVEEARLELDADLVAPAAMTGIGFAIAAAGATTLTVSLYEQTVARNRWFAAGDAFGDAAFIVTDVFAVFHAISGLAIGIAGAKWLADRQADQAERHRLRARITELESSGATYDRVAVGQRRAELFATMAPTHALPGWLLAAGINVALAGVFTLAVFNDSATGLTAGIAETSIGAALTLFAAWLLHYRSLQRDDEKWTPEPSPGS